MATVNFYLKDKNAITNTLIYLYFNYDNERIRVSTGCSLPPKYWNSTKQKAKELMEFPEHQAVNDRLKELEDIILHIHKKHREEGFIPSASELKKEFKGFKGNPTQETKKKGFWAYFEDFVEFKRKEIKDVKDYNNSLRKHLQKAEEITKTTLNFGALKEQHDGFVSSLDEYLTYDAINANGEEGLSTNTIGKQHKNLKAFLNWCFDRDIFPRFSLSHLPTLMEDLDKVYLTEEELIKITKVKLDVKHDLVRDLFLIGCETALRFSDFTTLTKSSITNGQIHHHPKKTNNSLKNHKVVIPISQRLRDILDKYDGTPPTCSMKITDFNKQLREICEKAKINDDVIQYRRVKNVPTKQVLKKYELVTSHTARRTFCTLKFLKEMPTVAIMKFSGHTTERSFLKYLKMDAELVAQKFVDYF